MINATGTVNNAVTGEPVGDFRVIPGQKEANRRTMWRRNLGRSFTDGKFEWNGGFWRPGAMLLRVEARGYLSAALEAVEGAVLEFRLQPGPPTRGRVVHSDGSAPGETSVVIVSHMAAIKNGALEPGGANLALCTGPDGVFAFPSQEPPYAIVALNDYGCVIMTSEEFAKEPVLRLQPWGRLEVLTREEQPFEISIEVPRDERRIPWVFFRMEPKIPVRNRVTFEHLLPGYASVYVKDQRRHGVRVRIKDGETVALDFERGSGASDVVAVEVVDENGAPVEGATVTTQFYGLKTPPGSDTQRQMSTSPAPQRITNRLGIALVSCPGKLRRSAGDEIESIELMIAHPEFCTALVKATPEGNGPPVILRRGAMVTFTPYFEADGSAPDRVYIQTVTALGLETDVWTPGPGGVLVGRQVPQGIHFVRLAYLPEDAPAQFSDLIEVNATKGDVLEFRVPLKPGVRIAGRLGDNVPRPVTGGEVELFALTDCPGTEKPMQWHTWRNVAPDGTFFFEAIPPGTLELTAVCEGYVSRQPGEFEGEVLAMDRGATVRLKVKDQEGLAVPKASVFIHAGETPPRPHGKYLAGLGLTIEEYLRLEPEERDKPHRHRGRIAKFFGRTDENGLATVGPLPPGKLKLRIVYLLHKAFWTDLELKPGETRELELTLP